MADEVRKSDGLSKEESLALLVEERDFWLGFQKTVWWDKYKAVLLEKRLAYSIDLRSPSADIGGVLRTELAKGGLVATEFAIAYPEAKVNELNVTITLKEKRMPKDVE